MAVLSVGHPRPNIRHPLLRPASAVNQITDVGARALADGLAANRALRKLNLTCMRAALPPSPGRPFGGCNPPPGELSPTRPSGFQSISKRNPRIPDFIKTICFIFSLSPPRPLIPTASVPGAPPGD